MSTAIGADGVDAQDFGMVVFKYKNGVSFAKSTALEHNGFERRQLVVNGTKGTVEIKPFEQFAEDIPGVFQAQITGVREAFTESWTEKAPYHETEPYGRYDAMLRKFAAYVKGEEKNPFDYEYERELHKLILKACGK